MTDSKIFTENLLCRVATGPEMAIQCDGVTQGNLDSSSGAPMILVGQVAHLSQSPLFFFKKG